MIVKKIKEYAKLRAGAYLFQSKLLLEKSPSEISISRCRRKTSADSARVNEFVLFLKANEGEDVETREGGEERYHGSPAATVYQALIRWREGSLFPLLFSLRPASRDPQMQIPDRIYSACRKCARTVEDASPSDGNRDPLSFRNFLAVNFCEPRVLRRNIVLHEFHKIQIVKSKLFFFFYKK